MADPIVVCECGEAIVVHQSWLWCQCPHCCRPHHIGSLPPIVPAAPAPTPAKYRVVIHLMSNDGSVDVVSSGRWRDNPVDALLKAQAAVKDMRMELYEKALKGVK